MRLKNVFRLLILVLIVTTFYFAVFRDHSNRVGTSHPQQTRRPERRGGEDSARSPRAEDHGSRLRHIEPSLEADFGLSCSSEYFSRWTNPDAASCQVSFKDQFPLPDPRCTPGGFNPSISARILRDPRWRTRFVRNCDSSEAQKHIAYRWYGIQKPQINSNQNQVCELDHLVPLELGGADGLGNIWPQCGPDAVTLNDRYFKEKDHVENYLAEEVKSGRMDLAAAQRGIASDWTQYVPAANHWCQDSRRC